MRSRVRVQLAIENPFLRRDLSQKLLAGCWLRGGLQDWLTWRMPWSPIEKSVLCHRSVEDLAILFQAEHQLAALEKRIVRLDIPGAATDDTGFFSIG